MNDLHKKLRSEGLGIQDEEVVTNQPNQPTRSFLTAVDSSRTSTNSNLETTFFETVRGFYALLDGENVNYGAFSSIAIGYVRKCVLVDYLQESN